MNKTELRKLSDLNKLPNNPRTIKSDSFQKLCESLKNSPDYFEARPLILSDRTGELIVIAGNQRYEAAKANGLKEVPTYLLSGLTEEKEREIIIRDNVNNGEWNWDALANEWNAEDLESWGLDVPIFDEEIDGLEDGEEIELPQSVQLEPPKEYILIMAEPNSVEWEDLKQTLKLGMVRRGGYKEGSPLDNIALERVMNWTDLKERLNVNSSTK